MTYPIVISGAVVAGGVFGEPAIGDGWWDLANRGVSTSMVVDVDELIDQALKTGECFGGWSGGHPFLEGLLEPFDFASGGRVVGSSVFVVDAQLGESGLDLIPAAPEPGEPNGVNGNPSGS